jgi:hypothetical protein
MTSLLPDTIPRRMVEGEAPPPPDQPPSATSASTADLDTLVTTPPTSDPSTAASESWLDTAGKLAVPLSLAGYLFGFLVAVPHYARAGVPVHALSTLTFVAAGLLFAVMSAIVAAGAALIRGEFRTRAENGRAVHPKAKRRRWWGLLVGLSFPFTLANQISSDWRTGVLVLLAVVINALAWPWAMRFSFDRHNVDTDLWNFARALSLLILPIGLFATISYPQIPAKYGGGQPTVLIAYPPGAASALSKHDTWAALECRWKPGHKETSQSGCRTIYKVYETDAYLFVAIVDDDAPCPERPREWKAWGAFTTPKNSCFQRIQNSNVERLELLNRP